MILSNYELIFRSAKNGGLEFHSPWEQIWSVPDVISGGQRARLWLLMAAAVVLTGCAPRTVDATFPQIAIRKPLGSGPKIGVAAVGDSRATKLAGEAGDASLIVGAGLSRYIDCKFRNALTDRGFQSSAVSDPADTSVRTPDKVVVLTLQSVSLGSLETGATLKSTVSIALQVYSSPRKLIYGKSFWGTYSAGIGAFSSAEGLTGNFIAQAADRAVEAAVADPKFEKALR